MTEKLEEFLNMQNPEKWDFTNDCNCENYIKIQNPIEKYLIYKSLVINEKKETVYLAAQKLVIKNKKTYTGILDPDTNSKLLQEIYRILWNDIISENYIEIKGKIQADTMTSVTNSINQYFEKNVETEEEMKLTRQSKRTTKYYLTELYARNPNKFIERLGKNKNFERFILMYHTLGNFIVTPHLFNSSRSGKNAIHDYFDLTLTKIKEWYMEDDNNKKDEILKTLLHKKSINEEAIENCRNWLKYYGDSKNGWDNFINKNYLDDFIDKNGEPIMFCNHTWNNSDIPEDEFDIFFKTVSDLIEKRGKRLIEKLKKQSKLKM